jgi:hypothetical protein
MIPFAYSCLERIMAQRRIGQEALGFTPKAEAKRASTRFLL